MSPSPRPRPNRRDRADSAPLSLQTRAESDLAFVRTVLERAHQFTAVPGTGGMLMGATAIGAALIAFKQPSSPRWFGVWMAEAVLASAIAVGSMLHKARRTGQPLAAGPARRFALGLVPPLFAGGVLTLAAVHAHAWAMLAPIWLACYGGAVLGGGMVSAVPAVPVLGAMFLLASALCVVTPSSWTDAWMGVAFGVGHLVVGFIVRARYGG